jgi:predicted O-linked N-acetylglucosamine transferase (SPINDLY family)
LNNLGNALRAQGRLDEAMGHYRQALALRPDFAEAHNNVGVTLQDQGKLDEAITHLRQAVALQPALAGAHSNLGRALEARGLLEDAVACYTQALALQPTLAEAHNNLGNILRALGRLAESEVHYRQALSLKPEYTKAHSNLAVTLRDQGRFQESADSYRRAMALEPGIASIHSNLIFDMAYYTDTPRAITQELRKWEKQYARPLAASRPTHNNDRNADRRLRVGYVSADFHGHAVGFFIQPLLAAHDRAQVEIFGYANGDGAAQTIAQLHGLANVWRNIAGMTDEAVAQLIASDRIDILIDLSGHTSNNRLLVFARKPAPIQMTYLGSVTSSGMPAMDYRLLDRLLAPPDGAEWSSETVIRLPGYFACYRPPADAPPVGPLPAAAAGHVTFGSFNNLAKVTPEVLALWSRILRRLPKARLILKDRILVDQAQRDRYWGLLKRHGIAAERVELLPRTTWGEYLAAYGRVDIALDPFPYNGGATTCEALWMGVPVVTLAGAMAYGRYGVSLLSNLGLPHLVATTPASYVTIAVELAKKRKPLAVLRAELRPRMAASVLCDAKGFAQGVEQAYRRVWKRWCRSQS